MHSALIIATALARGLGHLHGQGLVHRDVKPANVIFVHGRARLADMGLVDEEGRMSFAGTEGYVAPEGTGTPAADLYSLGLVLYEMTTGLDRKRFPPTATEMVDRARSGLAGAARSHPPRLRGCRTGDIKAPPRWKRTWP